MTYSRNRERDVLDYAVPIGGSLAGMGAGVYGSQMARARYLRGVGAARGEKAFAKGNTTMIRANQISPDDKGVFPEPRGRRVQVLSRRVRAGAPVSSVALDKRIKIGVNPEKALDIGGYGPHNMVNKAGPYLEEVGGGSRSYNSQVARRRKSGTNKGSAIEYDADSMRAAKRKALTKQVNAYNLIGMDARRSQNYLGGVGSAITNKGKARGVGDYFGNLRKAVSKRSGMGTLRLGAGGVGGAIIGGALGSRANEALRAAGYY